MICLDTDYIIDFLNGKNYAVNKFEKYKSDLVTTEINSFEVFLGIYKKKKLGKNEEKITSLFFDSIKVLPMKENDGKVAAKILADLFKKGKVIQQNDVKIASIMMNNNCKKIITNNKKHFSSIKGIEVV